MEIQHSTQDGCQVVTLTGSIDLFSVSQIQRALVKDLSEEPFALICDLAGVDNLDPGCATVFATVANHPSSRWPATSFLLCGARPPYLRDELVLAPIPTAAATARVFVRDLLGYWQLALADTTLVDRAVLLASELVTNAVVHARTELRLRVELRGELLHLAVRDGSPRLLRLVTIPDLEAEGGRGLWLVEQLARAWGVNRHPDGGKVVWCTLRL
jgi:anti-sigma regulatory factor (Ser/Thr protein kinase)/anti-anti-sigma regulatory factor